MNSASFVHALPRIRRVLFVPGVAAICVAAFFVSIFPSLHASSLTTTSMSPSEFRSALTAAGLGPEPLAVAGVEAGAVADVVQAAKSRYMMVRSQLEAVQSEVEASRRLEYSAQRSVEAGTATATDLAALDSVRRRRAEAVAARDVVLADVHAAATAVLSESRRIAMTRLLDRSPLDLPLYCRGASWDEAYRLKVRDARDAIRAAGTLGDPPPAAATALLAQAMSDPTVAEGKALFDLHFDSVTSAWLAATLAR